ncbi:MAG: 2OG-Fe(II) oxygenase [Reichenbachiella sp.]|uniref:2OG-Fe(II) oxygenase n=1 Tax=Reichenbachiella sp. TaxID=2184521 RepID=UPI003266C72E
MSSRILLSEIDWLSVTADLNQNGYAYISDVLSKEVCNELIGAYENPDLYRKIVVMERHRFGLGEYKYFDYPLLSIVQQLREDLYSHIRAVANLWQGVLKLGSQFPDTHEQWIEYCHSQGQIEATPLILKYGKGGFNTLHQDMYGEVYFPLQAAFFLNDPNTDYQGGEFVLTEQVPRAQSKVMVLKPDRGAVVIFASNFRPIKGSRGYYRATMRHGVSEVRSGNRHTLGIIFHDALK